MDQKELYHYGVRGQKHGHRRWQDYSGHLTPEGRIHYGVGPPRDKNIDGGKENTHKKPDDKETGYEKLTKKAKTLREKYAKAKPEIEKTLKEVKEGFDNAKKESAEIAKKMYSDAKKRADEAKQLYEEKKEEKEKGQKETRAQGDRSSEWREYSDAELQAYTARKRLEDAAKDATFAAKMQKIDRFRQVLNEANNYMTTGLNLYDNYKKLKVVFDPPQENKPAPTMSSTLAKDVLDKFGSMPADDIIKAFNDIAMLQELEGATRNSKINFGIANSLKNNKQSK